MTTHLIADGEWTRWHENGRIAHVRRQGDKYSFGLIREGSAMPVEYATEQSLEAAQHRADAETGCPQPYSCPDWTQD